MTDQLMPEFADWRRAGALMLHQTRGDQGGVTVIYEEANALGRLTQLFRALEAGYTIWVHQLRTDDAREMIAEFIAATASQHPDAYTRRAASAVVAARSDDLDALAAVLDETRSEHGAGRMIGALLDLYAFLLPELATATGQEQLAAWTMQAASQQ